MRMKHLLKMALAALLAATFPLTCRADMGSVVGAVVIAFWIALAIWTGLTLAVFRLLRRRTVFVRFTATALFFISPVLLGGGDCVQGRTV